MTRLSAVLLFVIFSAHAQDPNGKQPPLNANVSGVVKDSVTGKPLANYSVSTEVNATWVNNAIITSSSTKTVKATTDESGRYKLSDLPTGHYRIMARDTQSFGSELTKNILLSGHDMDGLDFPIVVAGTISGKVVDENKEPVPEMTVLLVSKEYFLGTVGYFLKSSGRTNDRGEYKIARVEAGHPYLLVAERRPMRIAALSETPLNPRLRRRVPMRTWYLSSPVKEGAVSLTLRPGENREGVDIEVKKSASYCIEGVLSTPNGPGPLSFMIEPQQPSSGISSGGGMFISSPSGMTGPDGKFRICDLYPGAYRLLAMEQAPGMHSPPAYYAATIITVADRDITGLKIGATAGMEVEGEVVLEGPAPKEPITAKINVFPAPRLRSSFGESTGGRYQIPSKFSWKGVMMDDYAIRPFLNAPGLYVKDVTYSDRSVMYEPVVFGSALGNAELKVTVAQDGATLSVRVADKDGNPVPDAQVLVMPADAPSEGVLAARIVTGQTDQAGQYSSPTLPPGKYFAAAGAEKFNSTEENTQKLWRSRNHFTEVTLPPNGNVQVNLAPMP